MTGFGHTQSFGHAREVPIIDAQRSVTSPRSIDEELYIRSSHGTLGRCHGSTPIRALIEVRTVGQHIYKPYEILETLSLRDHFESTMTLFYAYLKDVSNCQSASQIHH